MIPKLLQINLFCSKVSRFDFTLKMVKEIEKIDNKAGIKLCIYGEQSNISLWSTYFAETKPTFNTELITFENGNYLSKVNHAHATDYPYSCKLDDDILMSHYVWEFIITKLNEITDYNPIIAPIFTNGIPSANLFVEDFLNEEDKQLAHKYFLNGTINPNEWGLNFNSINQNIKLMSKWNDEEYWNMVSEVNTEWDIRPLPWYYYMVRGVHPARYSKEYNMFIANRIVRNSEKFFSKQEYKLETYKAPYFCNNLFFCKTKFWKESFKLFSDGWDEGQLTLKMSLNKATPLYVRNGFAIHMAYGMTIGQQEIENYYSSNIKVT